MSAIQKTERSCSSLYLLTFGEFWDRFSYFGTLTILVLYLTNFFLFKDNKSYLLYGVYIAFCFATPVLGGILADRLIGFNRAIIFGAIFLIIGNSLLIFPSLHFFYLGLSLTICGTGLYKPACTSLVGFLYDKGKLSNENSGEKVKKEKGFAIFYAGMNLGAVFGPLVYGVIYHFLGWRYVFLFSAIGIFIALVLYLLCVKKNKQNHKSKNIKNKKLFSFLYQGLSNLGIGIGIALIGLLITFVFYHPHYFNNFLEVFGIITLLTLCWVAINKDKTTRNHLLAIIILDVFCIFFFAFTLQVGSSITIFIERNIQRTLFGWQIPTMMFSSLDPLFVVLTAPIFAMIWGYLSRKNREPSVSSKLSIGFILASLGFLCFMLSAKASLFSEGHLSLWYIVLGNLFLGAGEICLAPAVLSAISEFMPKNLMGMMMGVWFLSVAFAGSLAGFIAKLTSSASVQQYGVDLYVRSFTEIAIFSLMAGLIILIMTPVIKRLFREDVKS